MERQDAVECFERAHGTCGSCGGTGVVSTPRGAMPCDCTGLPKTVS